jgi:hypothetical protein
MPRQGRHLSGTIPESGESVSARDELAPTQNAVASELHPGFDGLAKLVDTDH